jgi:hypothetical protein
MWRITKSLRSRLGLALASTAVVASALLCTPAAEALRFLGCDWSIRGNCLHGDCEWFGIEFTIDICIS